MDRQNRSNSQISMRTFELPHQRPNNMESIIAEREDFNHDTRNNFNHDERNNSSQQRNNNNKIGEITGEEFQATSIDQGMPMRSAFNAKRNDEESDKSYNKYLNFDIYDDEKPDNLNVSYYDPSGGSMFNFSDMKKSNLAKNSADSNMALMNNVINDFNWFIFENIRKLMGDTTLVASYQIINIMGSLYMSSKGNTEHELNNYFHFPTKEVIHTGLLGLKKYIDKSQCIDFRDIILINKKYQVASSFINNLKDLNGIFVVDPQQPILESHKINVWLNKLFGNLPGMVFNKDHISKMEINCLSIGVIRTTWAQPFDNVFKNRFYAKHASNIKMMDMMQSYGKTHYYFESNDFQLLEMRMFDNILSMGYILPKSTINIPDVKEKDIQVCIRNLQATVIDELVIPKFMKQCKLRISSLFKKSGLEQIFHRVDIPELIDKPGVITDIVQNFTIIVDESYNESQNSSKDKNVHGINSNRKFIANRPFIFYFRCIQTDTIILTGQFY